jgi:hypothetical protein
VVGTVVLCSKWTIGRIGREHKEVIDFRMLWIGRDGKVS